VTHRVIDALPTYEHRPHHRPTGSMRTFSIDDKPIQERNYSCSFRFKFANNIHSSFESQASDVQTYIFLITAKISGWSFFGVDLWCWGLQRANTSG